MAPQEGQLAWLGLGNMGRGMCKNLVEKGELTKPLIIFNRTQKRADDLATKLGTDKTKVASTIEEAVKPADLIFTCVGDDAAIKETIETALKSNVEGKIFVDCSTVHPDTTNELAKMITGRGAQFVACPVFGAPAAADAGQLVSVLAGPTPIVDLVKPFTKGVMAREDIDLSGQKHGQATLLKMIGNTMIIQMVEALGEGFTLAEKTGCGAENLSKFVENIFPGPYVAYSKRMLTGDYYQREEPLFAVDLARKDVRHALDLASDAGAKMPALEVVARHLDEVKEHMGTRGDIAGIYGAARKEAGLKFENQD